jgi:putative transcriptional regulator
MPIVINLDLMLVKRKMSLTQLSEKVNVTIANLSILKQNKARAIRFSTLSAICAALECQPADLLEWKPGEEPPAADVADVRTGDVPENPPARDETSWRAW